MSAEWEYVHLSNISNQVMLVPAFHIPQTRDQS